MQLADKGEAEAGTDNYQLMTPLRTKEAVSFQVPPLITAARTAILGGSSSTCDTLQKLFNYITNTFYNRSQSDARYDKKIDTISCTRISSGISASNITTGTLIGCLTSAHPKLLQVRSSTYRISSLDASRIASGTLADARIPNLDASKITTGTLHKDRIPEITRTKLSSNVQVALGNNAIFFSTLTIPNAAGRWVFSFTYTLELNATAAYEVFIATATTLRVFTLASHRRNVGTITSAFYENGNISRGAVASTVVEAADNTSGNSYDRILYVKPLRSFSAKALSCIDLSHRIATNISGSLSPLHST